MVTSWSPSYGAGFPTTDRPAQAPTTSMRFFATARLARTWQIWALNPLLLLKALLNRDGGILVFKSGSPSLTSTTL